MELRNYTNIPEQGTKVFSGSGKYSNISKIATVTITQANARYQYLNDSFTFVVINNYLYTILLMIKSIS